MLINILRTYTGPYRVRVAVVLVLLLLQTMANLAVPSLNADIVNNGVAKGDTPYIWRVGAVMLGVTAVQAALSMLTVYLASRVAMAFARDLRSDVFRRVLSFSTQEMDAFSNASLITRNTNDVQQVQTLVYMGLMMLISAPITMIGGVLMALRHNLQMSGLIAVTVPLMGIVIGIMMKFSLPQFRVMQTRVDRVNGVMREQITGLRVIRAFVRDAVEQVRFETASAELRDTQLRVNRLFAFAMPTLMFIMNLSTVGVVWFGGNLVATGDMLIGDIGAFMAYMMQILMSVMMATMGLIMVPRAVASAERIHAVLHTTPGIDNPRSPIAAAAPGAVSLHDVTFQYPGAEEAVLHNISFAVEPGQFAAIVGGTGSGKTTLVNLLMRFYDASAGSVRVNGTDVREQDLAQMWSTVALVPQRALLFSGSVRDNVRFGAQDIDDEAVWRALEVAQARDFVEALDAGLEHEIAQGGQNLSGGQKQRLSIARAVAMRPSIYVLDDAFSALDAATDARLRAALHHEMAGATVIVVAQRISTILHADRIIVLDEGAVAGVGTHDELMASCAAYREIVGSQLEVNA